MKANRKFFLFLFVMFVVFVVIFLTVAYFQEQAYARWQHAKLENRQHIFCGLIKPGMDKQTVLETIEQFGVFRYSKTEQSSEESDFNIHGGFDDVDVAGSDYFYLIFRDGKYVDVWIEKGSGFQPICHP
jgi:hypothetical protein